MDTHAPAGPTEGAAARTPLTRDRVMQGALDLADTIGVETFTMRRLATALDVKPMTIYHDVAGKEQIIDGIVDLVFAQIRLPPEDVPWIEALRIRCHSAREVLARHPWATALMETRSSPGPANLEHHDAMLGCLRRGGLTIEQTVHAYGIIDSYLFGFALQEGAALEDRAELGAAADRIAARAPMADYPNLDEVMGHVVQHGYSLASAFDFGLDLILEGIERMAPGERTGST